MRFTTLATIATVCLASLATGCAAEEAASDDAANAAPAAAAESAQSAAGRVGAHGMVVAGDPAHTFLSHIPTFGPPHDVQLVVAGAMTTATGRPLPATFSDRSYTFLPERTSLDALRLGVTRELRGTLYLGNFEQGGRPVASGVRFAVDHVVHQHLLVASPPDAGPDAGSEPTYVVFGTRDHAFAVHYIAAAPSFDVVDPASPGDARLRRVVDEVLVVKLGADAPSDADLAHGVMRANVTKVRTLSCLVGPDFFGPCD